MPKSDDAIPRTLLRTWDDELEITRAGAVQESMLLPERGNRRILSLLEMPGRSDWEILKSVVHVLREGQGFSGPFVGSKTHVLVLYWGDTASIDCTDHEGYCIRLMSRWNPR